MRPVPCAHHYSAIVHYTAAHRRQTTVFVSRTSNGSLTGSSAEQHDDIAMLQYRYHTKEFITFSGR